MNELERIKQLNQALAQIVLPPQDEAQASSHKPNLYIIGCPRSGTTVLLQYLARTQIWDVPSNLMARFTSSPYIGLLVQQLLLDEGTLSPTNSDYKSHYGRSKGLLNTNEFFHFFRRYIDTIDIAHLSESQIQNARIKEMFSKLNEPSRLSGKPFLTKAMMLQYNLTDFAAHCSKDIFLYTKREPIFTMQSIYQARIKETGCINTWWSAKPAQYPSLKDLPYASQIAGQVYYTEKAIEAGLRSLDSKRYVQIAYEDLVSNPAGILNSICDKYQQNGFDLPATTLSQTPLSNQNTEKLDPSILAQLQQAYADLQQKHGM
ncbi:sulfotransferase [Glaciecola siphonariae]|uniref:Sulfotransferase n=1 Tax=Glaciecola siphonariae TaxID=521012 RepID=A0ABV9LVX4_9ALTE